MFDTVLIAGLGLMGGSMAKTIKARTLSRVLGWNRTRATAEQALADGSIDAIATEALYKEADLVIIGLYPQATVDWLLENMPKMKKGCVIVDMVGVKQFMVDHLEQAALDAGVHYVGGHPMAGSEKTGYESSTDHLLENAYYIITPTKKSTPEQIDRIRQVALGIGALPIVLDYHEHDFSVAAISHLPHLVASSLVNLVHDNDSKDEIMKRLAAGGFKDITRIASSSPVMWEQICMTNTENILVLLKRYITSLESICDTLENHNGDAIYKMFEESGKYRSTFPNRGQGPIERDYSFCVDVLDEPGSISVLSAILAAKGISVKNIGINHSREEGEGALRISFYKEDKKNEAAELLRSHNYVLTK